MKFHSARFVCSAGDSEQYPASKLPRIAFAGRSNVGKSSLINALVGVSGLAKTSHTPGRTQRLNFFLVDEKFYFIDLPGYGFARAPKQARDRWGSFTEKFFQDSDQVALVLLLVDGRHSPMQIDIQMKCWLESLTVPFRVVATKIDASGGSERHKRLRELRGQFGFGLLACSARKKEGLKEIWKEINRAVRAGAEARQGLQ
ncbi:MAG TPA: ribosome biogenesis GTP-binding protein YihA/YsxC [Acidobacteriota bacterium]|jgi:GTP-binding protein